MNVFVIIDFVRVILYESVGFPKGCRMNKAADHYFLKYSGDGQHRVAMTDWKKVLLIIILFGIIINYF